MKRTLLFALLAVLCAKAIGQTTGTEIEPNDALASANLLVLGSYATNAAHDTGCHFSWTDVDYYRVNIPQAGVLSVTIPSSLTGGYGLDINIIDSATSASVSDYYNPSTPVTNEAIICGGTYYIKVINCCSGGYLPGTFPYALNVTFYPDTTECNNTTFTAYPVNSGKMITGYIRGVNKENIPSFSSLDVDYYKVHNTDCGLLTAKIPVNPTAIDFEIAVTDSSSGTVIRDNWSTVGGAAVTDTVSVAPGTYYVEVSSRSGNSDSNPYTLYVNLTNCPSTKIDEVNEATENISIYPNPNNGSFTINANASANQEVKITITNITGEKLQEFSTATQSILINLNEPAGVYFLNISTPCLNSTHKIIIYK